MINSTELETEDDLLGSAFITIGLDGSEHPFVILKVTGEVEFGPEYTPTAAAEAFWATMNQFSPFKVVTDLLKVLAEGCQEHRSYRGRRDPRGFCNGCEQIREARQTLDHMEVV